MVVEYNKNNIVIADKNLSKKFGINENLKQPADYRYQVFSLMLFILRIEIRIQNVFNKPLRSTVFTRQSTVL